MITWSGYIGKLSMFILTKVLEKKIDLSLDERKQAAKAFYNLFETLVEIENLTTEFLVEIKPIVEEKKSSLSSSWLIEFSKRVNTASQRYVGTFHDLNKTLRIYDPTLSSMFLRIVRSKEGIGFIRVSKAHNRMKFEFKWKDGQDSSLLESIQYSMPTKRLLNIDLQKKYDKFAKQNWWRYWWEYLSDKDTDAHLSLLNGRYKEGQIAIGDIKKIKKICHLISQHHLPVVVQARESLRKFLKENFPMEDIHYVAKL